MQWQLQLQLIPYLVNTTPDTWNMQARYPITAAIWSKTTVTVVGDLTILEGRKLDTWCFNGITHTQASVGADQIACVNTAYYTDRN